MDERRNRMDEPTDEEIAERLSASLFGEDPADEDENSAGAPIIGGQAFDGSADALDLNAEYGAIGADEAESIPDGPYIPEGMANDDGMSAPDYHRARQADPYRAPEQEDLGDYYDEYDEQALEYPDEFDMETPRVESFVPTEAYRERPPKRSKKKHHKTKRNYAWLALVALGVVLLIAGGVYLYNVRYNPSSFFGADAQSEINSVPTPSPNVVTQQVELEPQATPAPTPTLDPYAALVAQADTSMMQNIVNILIIGVDYAEERETWSGKKEWHSDVMMVLAVNFDENRADLISLPRDTYAKIPGVKGIYKLNAAINCGGGMDAPGGAGFLKVCEAASWMLGGIPVNYYYAVTMPAVKNLVDAVGGVDYDLEMSYTMMGRRYYKGQQHMDGQGVLDYLRVRKNVSQSGDVNRVNRQKKMMVALFESMKQQNLLLRIPDIVNSFNGQLFTNCTMSQTAALASFAYGLDKENIGMYSMTSKGGGNTNIFNWNFCLTDQPARVQLIKNVYGVDVPEEKEYTPAYAKYRWAEMRADKYVDTCNKLINKVANDIAHGQMYIEPVIPVDPGIPQEPGNYVQPADPWADGVTGGVPDAGAVGYNGFIAQTYGIRVSIPVLSIQYTQSGLDQYNSLRQQVRDFEDIREKAARQAEKYVNGESNSFSGASSSFISALDSLKSTATNLAASFGYGELNWSVSYEKDKSFNEVTVNFN